MIRLAVISFMFSWAFAVCPVFADTDYSCLKTCIRGGGTYFTCMPDCNYAGSKSSQAGENLTGYSCIKSCMDKGEKLAACSSRCTAKDPPAAMNAAGHPPNTSSHDILKAPRVSDEVILSPSKTSETHLQETDYSCIRQCMQGGSGYSLCNQRCLK